MIILYPPTEQTSDTMPQAIAIFGLGLLGDSILQSIIDQAGSLNQQRCEFDWFPGKQQSNQVQKILKRLVEISNISCAGSRRIVVLWSAGSAGFASSNEDITKELESFNVVLDMAIRLQSVSQSTTIEFHLLSSAGGLFEGCPHVTQQTRPRPLRPYGNLKLAQEKQLLSQDSLIPRIYRPSTVYGPISAGIRRGLVSTLLHNGTLRIVSNILGHFYTLRDYVYYEDIGKYIAANILYGPVSVEDPVNYLISGKPTSIYEIIKTIERILCHPLYYQLQYDPDNSCDMSFSPNLFPEHWQPTSLHFGCENIYNLWRTTSIERAF